MRVDVIYRSQHRLSATSTGWFLSRFTRTSSDEEDGGAPQDDDEDDDGGGNEDDDDTGGVGFATQSATQVAFKKLQQHQKEQRLQLLENYVEYIDHIIFLLAMLGFVIGSVFFFPQFDPGNGLGEYIFTVASLMVLYLNGNDLVEVLKAPSSSSNNNNNHAVVIRKSNRASGVTTQPNHTTSLDDHFEQQQQENSTKDQRLDVLAPVFYIIGALLFTGPFFIWFPLTGGWLFVIGSLFFILGAFVNSLQIWDSPDRISAQMANTIVILYVIGSTMFFVASLPYVYTYDDERDTSLIDDISSSFYLIGSILYFVTGILEIRRSQYIKKHRFFENNDDDSDDDDDSGDDDDNDASAITLEQLKQTTETTRTNTTADFSSALIGENN